MPLDSDPPAPSTHRNRFFPSPSFTTQSNLRSKTLTRNPKNLTSFPSPSRTPKSYISPSRSQTFASSRSFSSSPSIPRRNARYAGIHRKVDSASQYEKSSKPDVSEVVTGKMTDVRKALKGFKVGRSNVRWNLALSVVLMVTCLSSLLHKNFTLQNQVKGLQGSLLNQLAIANESLGGGTVVVMAERDKEEMELDIAKMEFDFKGTPVICRSGCPLILADLKKVSVSKARAVIVLAEDGNADQSDARALRTVLGLTGVKEGLRGHIVVELSDLDNEVLVKLVGGDLVETVVAHDVIGRLMIQCARQPGLAQIWEDILGFEKSEFYIKRWPQLDGMRFQDVLISFPDAIPCGIKVASSRGKIILNPDDSYVLQEGDEVLVIAEDDDSYSPTTLPMVWRGFLPKDFIVPKSPERILFCGWRRDMEDMIMVLDAFLAPGSELWMFNDVPEKEREKKLIEGGLDTGRLVNISLVNREGNAVIRRHLESIPLESFDSILILADESVEDSAIQADSRSLATLLLIRDIQAKRLPYREAMVTHVHRGSFSKGSWMGEMQQASDKSVIISEILDPRTKNLLSMSKISDYVLSNELVSMALAMVAEDRQINDVLEELFAEEGNELHIRLADIYLHEDEELSFYEIILRARQRKEILIGYRLASAERAVINPPSKSERRRWSPKDVFVVIADKE
ncbi:probable ion channel CASTOR isoform X6 [Magnolia sinica]|uniref:probable ion channel CASTOR isoform X6 n=1 Tax=Magnolia sinica TaxID=86752 RepID=UPI002658B3C0|nr:probable ion channel CASTOR isoform X6 [Magnolia sinica]